MVQVKKILCAVDLGDKSAPTVMAHAGGMAKAYGAEVKVLYVIPLASVIYSDAPMKMDVIMEVESKMRQGGEERMVKFIADYLSDVNATGIVREGDPAQEILQVAEDEKVDMIIVGSRGLKGVKRIVFGSVAEKVVKNSHLPVLTVHPAR